MNDKPISFMSAMVRAIQDGRKNMTRRGLTLKGYKGFTEFQPSETKGYDWTFRRRDKAWCEATGNPTISHFSGAVQVFAVRNSPCTVQMAADTFKVEPVVIIEAVEFHPWMFLDGPDGDFTKLKIEHEGE